MTVKKVGILIIILVLCVATVLVAWLATNSGSVSVVEGDTSLTVSATNAGSTTIKYSSVEDLELVTSIDIGELVGEGISNSKIVAGEWECDKYDDFGTYYLFAYADVDTYIVITTNSKYVIFNCDSDEDTEELFNSLEIAIWGEEE